MNCKYFLQVCMLSFHFAGSLDAWTFLLCFAKFTSLVPTFLSRLRKYILLEELKDINLYFPPSISKFGFCQPLIKTKFIFVCVEKGI